MPYDFADLKSQARQTIHTVLGVPATYQDDVVVIPQDVRVRYHAKGQIIGDLDNGDYAQLYANDDKIVFLVEDATALAVKRGGIVTIAKYGKVLTLHDPIPTDGPVEVLWVVSEP